MFEKNSFNKFDKNNVLVEKLQASKVAYSNAARPAIRHGKKERVVTTN